MAEEHRQSFADFYLPLLKWRAVLDMFIWRNLPQATSLYRARARLPGTVEATLVRPV